MSNIVNYPPAQHQHLYNANSNPYGNPLPRCIPGLIPDKLTISCMAYRDTAVARRLSQMTVVRNVDISLKADGTPRLDSANQVLYWQNFLSTASNGTTVDLHNDIRSCILEAAMAQCVGVASHANCPGGTGPHTSCTKCASGSSAFTTCVDVGPLFPGSHPLLGSCPGCYWHGHGQRCSCRPGVLDGTYKEKAKQQPPKGGNGSGNGPKGNGNGNSSGSGLNSQRMIASS